MDSLPPPPPPPNNPFHRSSAPNKSRNSSVGQFRHPGTYACLFGTHVLTLSSAVSAFQIVYYALIMLLILGYDDWRMAQAKSLYSTLLAARIVACFLAMIGVHTGESKLFLPSIAFSWMALAGTLPLMVIDVALGVTNSVIEAACLYAVYRGYAYHLDGEEDIGEFESESNFDAESQNVEEEVAGEEPGKQVESSGDS